MYDFILWLSIYKIRENVLKRKFTGEERLKYNEKNIPAKQN